MRLPGRRAVDAVSVSDDNAITTTSAAAEQDAGVPSAALVSSPSAAAVLGPTLPALPLTPEAFAPFGHVVQAYADENAVPSPRSVRVTGANQGTAMKFHKLAPIVSSYPAGAGATPNLSVYRCKPIDVLPGGEWAVKLLERHPCTNQAFVPMGGAAPSEAVVGDAIADPGRAYLVIVAKNGADDKPDLASMRAFIASGGQGIVYNTGIWRECFWRRPDLASQALTMGLNDPLIRHLHNVGIPAGHTQQPLRRPSHGGVVSGRSSAPSLPRFPDARAD